MKTTAKQAIYLDVMAVLDLYSALQHYLARMHIDIFKNRSPRSLCALRYINGKPVAHCIFDSTRKCRSCGRYRELAPAIGVLPESTDKDRLALDI